MYCKKQFNASLYNQKDDQPENYQWFFLIFRSKIQKVNFYKVEFGS